MKKQVAILILFLITYNSLLKTFPIQHCAYTCENGKTIAGGTIPEENCEKIENCNNACEKLHSTCQKNHH